ncbi:MAG TPA: sigma-70 family RNA polymerase sigma factor [Myxococcaceae bacterium]|jgi:RNA polymerase sigma-70 factor (ECF subfamily)
MPEPSLTTWFLDALPAGRRPAPSDVLERALGQAVSAARSAHPELSSVTDEALARHLASCTGGPEELETLQAADVLLALASALGNGIALQELHRRIAQVVPRAVARLRNNSAFLEEVRQILSQRLLVPSDGATARVLDYKGKGPLERWLRAAALRVALNLIETDKSPREQGDSAIRALPDQGGDPELLLLRRRYAPEFKQAVETALRNLSTKERNFLRLYFVEGLTVEQIGAMQGTHKSTVSRWITRARETVGLQARTLLGDRLKLSAGELESLMGLLQSELELSLFRVL